MADTVSDSANFKDELQRPIRNRPAAYGIGKYGKGIYSQRDVTRYAWIRGKASVGALLLGLFMAASASADSFTTGLNLRKPDVDVEDTVTPWGEKINTNLDTLDAAILDKRSGGTISGQVTVANSSITLNGASGHLLSGSSITASAFFGNGAGITGLSGTDATKVAKAGDTMTGGLLMSASSITLTGSAGVVVSGSSITASSFYGNGAGLTGVSATDSTKVAKAGDTMTGQLTILGSTLTVTGNAFSVGGSTLTVSSGRVGISSSSPTELLGVGGNINVSGSYCNGAACGVTTTCGAGQFLSAAQWAGGIPVSGSCSSAGAGDAVLAATQTWSGANSYYSTTTINKSVADAGFSHITATATYNGVIKGVMSQVAASSATLASRVQFYNLSSTFTHRIDFVATQNTADAIWNLRIDDDTTGAYDWNAHRVAGAAIHATNTASADTECQLTGTDAQRSNGALANGDPITGWIELRRWPNQSLDKIAITWFFQWHRDASNRAGTVTGSCEYVSATGDGNISVGVFPAAGSITGFFDLYALVPLVAH